MTQAFEYLFRIGRNVSAKIVKMNKVTEEVSATIQKSPHLMNKTIGASHG